MTIELVDGHGGKPHISGDDLGDFKAGILGDAGYVFKRADMLEATLNGANSLTVNTGSGVLPISGRHFRITAPETVTVTSGTQGQNRNDLVVIRPSTSTDGTTVENASVVVLRGTPTDGDAVDPEKEDTDLALYRLQLTGISVADPIALFDVMIPYNEFRDSISQQVVESGHEEGWFWQKYADGTCVMDGKVSVRATGGTAWGNIWYDSSIRGGSALPFALKSLVVGTVHVVGGNGSFWATQATSGSPTTAPTWYACRATKGTEAINLQAAYHIVGTWK